MKEGVLSQTPKGVGGWSLQHVEKRKLVADLNSWIILTLSIRDKMVNEYIICLCARSIGTTRRTNIAKTSLDKLTGYDANKRFELNHGHAATAIWRGRSA